MIFGAATGGRTSGGDTGIGDGGVDGVPGAGAGEGEGGGGMIGEHWGEPQAPQKREVSLQRERKQVEVKPQVVVRRSH